MLNIKCRIGGLIESQPTMIMRREVKWHSHSGHHTRDMVQKVYQNKQTLEQEVSLRAGLPTFRSFLVNGIMVNWSPSQHNGLHSDIITVLSIHTGSWFRGWKNNSAKVMDTCWQQSNVNGIEVTLLTPIGKILTLFCFFILGINHMLFPDLYTAWIFIITNHGNGGDHDRL